jgi:hypothetical protein
LQKRYIGLILGILIVVVLSAGYIIDNMTGTVTNINMDGNTYSGDGVSFNIPANWQVSKIVDGSTTNIDITNNNPIVDGSIANIAMTNNTNYNPNNDTKITVAVSPIPKGMSNQHVIDMIQNPQNQGNYQKISNNTLTVDGITAYETLFRVNDSSISNEILTSEQIIFNKNGNTYGLTFQAPENTFNQEKSNFNITLNSFKVL